MIHKYGEDRSRSYFFDWLWRTGTIDSVSDWLADGLSLERIDWRLLPIEDRLEVCATQYGFVFPHEFTFSTNNYVACENEMKQKMSTFLSKYSYLRRKTLSALESGSPVAFLLQESITVEQFARLNEVLTSKYRMSQYRLFLFSDISDTRDQVRHERITSQPIVYQQWPGHESSWREALLKIDIELSS